MVLMTSRALCLTDHSFLDSSFAVDSFARGYHSFFFAFPDAGCHQNDMSLLIHVDHIVFYDSQVCTSPFPEIGMS